MDADPIEIGAGKRRDGMRGILVSPGSLPASRNDAKAESLSDFFQRERFEMGKKVSINAVGNDKGTSDGHDYSLLRLLHE